MTDAVLNRAKGYFDFSIAENGDVEQADFFDTAILVSIYEEKRASSSEVDLPQLRRGWIGNQASDDGFERGSKIWLYSQSRLDRDAINGITSAAKQCLEWLVDDGYADSVQVDVKPTQASVSLVVDIKPPDSPTVRKELFLWSNSGVTGVV